MTKPVVFDAYGTLLDVAAAARALAYSGEHPALKDIWADLANIWRDKQLAYTWLRNSMDAYRPFYDITHDALTFALEKHNLSFDLLGPLMDMYNRLPAYPEAMAVLQTVKAAGHPTAILSNGNYDMVHEAATAGGLSAHLDAILSVHPLKVFKPDQRVYQLACDAFNCQPDDVTFVSSNGWDIAGAAHFGFNTYWVNRSGDPVDQLPAKPHRIGSDLNDLLNHLGIKNA